MTNTLPFPKRGFKWTQGINLTQKINIFLQCWLCVQSIPSPFNDNTREVLISTLSILLQVLLIVGQCLNDTHIPFPIFCCEQEAPLQLCASSNAQAHRGRPGVGAPGQKKGWARVRGKEAKSCPASIHCTLKRHSGEKLNKCKPGYDATLHVDRYWRSMHFKSTEKKIVCHQFAFLVVRRRRTGKILFVWQETECLFVCLFVVFVFVFVFVLWEKQRYGQNSFPMTGDWGRVTISRFRTLVLAFLRRLNVKRRWKILLFSSQRNFMFQLWYW